MQFGNNLYRFGVNFKNNNELFTSEIIKFENYEKNTFEEKGILLLLLIFGEKIIRCTVYS